MADKSEMASSVWDLMPKPPGKIDQDRAFQWLAEHWKGDRECPICKTVTWGVSEDLLYLWSQERGPAYPCIVVACENCGHTLIFGAVKMGLAPNHKA